MRTFRMRPEVVAVAALLVIAGCAATEMAQKPPAPPAVQVVKIVAKRFDFTPEQITVKKGVPVDIELTTEDRLHGFIAPGLGLTGVWRGFELPAVLFAIAALALACARFRGHRVGR